MKSISERVDALLATNTPLQLRIGNKWVGFDGEPYELLKFHRSDIRAKPEKEFVIGDWWVPWNNATPEKLTKTNIPHYDGTRPFAQNTEPKLWRPAEMEWCWHKTRQLVQVTYKEPKIYSMVGYTLHGFQQDIKLKDCEPFLGKLPTFLNPRTNNE